MNPSNAVKEATKALMGLIRLVFLALGAAFFAVVLALLLSLALAILARVTQTLFEMIKAIFGG
jgi:hypothetical protein